MRRARYKMKQNNATFALNITSMTDMFTIMLVFLLQTYSTADVQVIPEKDINLPISNVETSAIKAPNISISRKELKLDGRMIASLEDGSFQTADLDNKDASFIKPLFAELDKLEKSRKESPAANDKDKDGVILIQADSSLSYQMLKKVMYTASMAGFPKLKMATIVGE